VSGTRAAGTAVDTTVDALAVSRLVRLWQVDEVWPMPELRDAFLRRAGDTRWADLASCPWCASVWIGVAVAAARRVFPRAWPVLARVLAASETAGHLAHLADR
jgi:hypothetical protein